MRVRSSLITAGFVVSFLVFSCLVFSSAGFVSGQDKKDGGAPAEKPRAPAEAPADKVPKKTVTPETVTPDTVPPVDDASQPSTAESLLRKAERHAAKELAAREAEKHPLRDPLRGMVQFPVGSDPGYYYGPYEWYSPWYRLPPTGWVKNYPPRITHVPQLGLQHNYPFAYQMGIHVPDDSDPLYVDPNLAPFVGVVGAAKAELAGAERVSQKDAGEEEDGATSAAAIALLKSGKYKEAGRILADHFQATEDPRDALLLAEVFFALGKASHAEMLLRHALESDHVLEALPKDVSKHFASSDELEKKLQDLESAGDHPLLAGYLKVHSRNPEAGLDLLNRLVKENPKDKGAGLLYRHYLGKVFQE